MSCNCICNCNCGEKKDLADKIAEKAVVAGVGAVVAGLVGFAIAGPPGAIIGAKIGGGAGLSS